MIKSDMFDIAVNQHGWVDITAELAQITIFKNGKIGIDTESVLFTPEEFAEIIRIRDAYLAEYGEVENE